MYVSGVVCDNMASEGRSDVFHLEGDCSEGEENVTR